MILIPELQTVLILVPRTGSGSLRRAIRAAYPRSMAVYRHMEADGVPFGYDHWAKVGIVRNPIDRLWSLYKFLKTFDGDYEKSYITAQRASVAAPFDEWLRTNQVVFGTPYDYDSSRFWPEYSVRHALPENRKSQRIYLRPDLGTTIVHYNELHRLADSWKIELGRSNVTDEEPAPKLSVESHWHMVTWFGWDFIADARYSRETHERLPV